MKCVQALLLFFFFIEKMIINCEMYHCNDYTDKKGEKVIVLYLCFQNKQKQLTIKEDSVPFICFQSKQKQLAIKGDSVLIMFPI